ncbi:antitoxin Xre/MbcA/ParS toxin-binding domain-containing protein [Rhizobium panacihumi]|uniref:antitoxin Xre/MbcA/ParS toxin-binding domain-containing protein n=1 Tax=Rhizobium panacihumi TaxID=2008450 RepID=UPI003D7AE805
MSSSKRAPIISEAQIMTQAAVIAADRLGLDTATFAATIGISETHVIDMTRLDHLLRKGTGPCDRALLLIRLFRALRHAGDEAAARDWLHGENDALGCRPVEMIGGQEGLDQVIRHVEGATENTSTKA